jgi:transcriptional regulator with XRE-family HTH domain
VRQPNLDRALRDLGRRIAELRHEAKLTQVQLAEKCELDAKHLQTLEAGRNTTVKTLLIIAQVLRVKPSELLEPPTGRVPRRVGRPRKP